MRGSSSTTVKISVFQTWLTAQSFINLNNHNLLKIHWNKTQNAQRKYIENHTHLTQIFYPGNPTWENQHSVYLSISYSRKVQKFTVTELCLADKLTVQICCPSSILDCLPISESPIMKWYTLVWDPLTPRFHECASHTLPLTCSHKCMLMHTHIL